MTGLWCVFIAKHVRDFISSVQRMARPLPRLPSSFCGARMKINKFTVRTRNAKETTFGLSVILGIIVIVIYIGAIVCVRHYAINVSYENAMYPCVRCANFSKQCRSEYRTQNALKRLICSLPGLYIDAGNGDGSSIRNKALNFCSN